MEVSSTVESESGLCQTEQGSVFATRPDGVCESSLRTGKYVSSPSPTRGNSAYDRRNSRDAEYHREFAVGNRGTRPDESFATSQLQRKQSAPLLSDHKPAVQTLKRMRCQPEIGLSSRPLSTKMCVLVYTDSVLQDADADPDEEGFDDEWMARAKQKGIRVRSQHGALVWWLRTIWRQLKPFQSLS